MKTTARRFGCAIALLLPTILIASCNSDSKVWSLELKSPDGKHVAYARSDIFSGLETDGANHS